MRYAVLGSPVSHSLSPSMQNAAFEARGLDAHYEAREVGPADLEAALASFHAEGYAGLNLTAPLKEIVWPHLSGATPEAEGLRSVNTLRRMSSGWEGHATDGLGFAAFAREEDLVTAGARVLLIGSGGAARAVAPYLARLGAATVTVVARDAARAAAVTALGERQNGGTGWSAVALEEPCEVGPFDLLVRALPPPLLVANEAGWWRAVSPGGTVFDMNYGARTSGIRQAADASGLRFVDGLGMLLHQGALSFTYWTGLPAPVDVMWKALESAVES